jgi:hypothetical protein
VVGCDDPSVVGVPFDPQAVVEAAITAAATRNDRARMTFTLNPRSAFTRSD